MRTLFALLPLLAFAVFSSCTKPAAGTTEPKAAPRLAYGGSVFYTTGNESETVRPVTAPDGSFTAFPEGLEIDPLTGAFNVSRSEKGMKYRITLQARTGDTQTAYITVAGINFPDKYYHLSSNDSIAFPVYNADPSLALPAGSFDEDHLAGNSGCAVKSSNGQINLKESIRRGLFGSTPRNDTRKDVEFSYRLNDASGGSLNKIKVLLYYFNTANDVPQDLKQTVDEHLAMTLQPDNSPVGTRAISSAARPRPPCLVIIAH